MQDASGKLATGEPDHTKTWWTWEGFARLRNLGHLETGRGSGQHRQTVPLDFLIQMHVATDHPAHLRILSEHTNKFRTIVQVHSIDPGQAQGPGMVMQKH